MRTDDWLKQLPPPDPTGPDRVWERLQSSRNRPSRRWPLAVAGGLVAAALALGFIATSDRSRTRSLDAADSQHVAWSADVQLDYQGEGVAEGTARELTVHWSEGILRAEVVPDRGNQVQVETAEALVTVVGTVFAVERSALGTSTWVDRGKVHVACTDGTEHDVTDDTGSVTCLPTRPGALLGRADALLARQATPELVLDTLSRGLEAAEPGSPTEGELLARRLEQEVQRGDVDAVLATGTAYVDAGHTLRLDAIAASAVRLAVEEGRCDAASTWLDRASAPLLDDRLAIARCWTDASADDRAVDVLHAARDAGELLPDPWLRWLQAAEAP